MLNNFVLNRQLESKLPSDNLKALKGKVIFTDSNIDITAEERRWFPNKKGARSTSKKPVDLSDYKSSKLAEVSKLRKDSSPPKRQHEVKRESSYKMKINLRDKRRMLEEEALRAVSIGTKAT